MIPITIRGTVVGLPGSSQNIISVYSIIQKPGRAEKTKTSCERNGPIRKTSRSAYRPLINPPPSLRKISYKYNYVDLYSGVVFVFFQKRVRVTVKNRVKVRVSFRVRVGSVTS